MTSLIDDYYDEDEQIFRDHDSLQRKSVNLEPEPEELPYYPPDKTGPDKGLDCLGLGSQSVPPSRSNSPDSEATLSPQTVDHSRAMSEGPVAAAAVLDGLHDVITRASRPDIASSGGPGTVPASGSDDLQKTAALAIRAGQSSPPEDIKDAFSRPPRVDSAQDSSESVPQLTSDKQSQRSGRVTPLRLQTTSAPAAGVPAASAGEDSLAKSPTLSKHMINLAPVQATSPTTEASATPARKESLPSFQHLSNLADIASSQRPQQPQQDGRPPVQHAHQHSHSFSSTTSQSPIVSYHPSYTNSAQTSPASFHTFGARSPTSTEGFSNYSPSQYPGNAYYTDRRISVAHESGPTYPTPVPSLPSQPSSGESQIGNAGATPDGYSTAHTTPIDQGSLGPDGMLRPILPPPPGMAITQVGGFLCDYPGCTALPFQTQYLLRYVQTLRSAFIFVI